MIPQAVQLSRLGLCHCIACRVNTFNKMSNIDQLTLEFLSGLSDYLNAEQTMDAISLAHDDKYKCCITENSGQIISVVSKYLSQEAESNTPDTFQCVEVILDRISEIANPENILLELLEEAEMTNDDVKFIALIKVLQHVLSKLVKKRGYSLMWCLDTIINHVSQFPEPKNYILENEERKLLDTDPSVQRIELFYSLLEPFIRQFVEEVSLSSTLLKISPLPEEAIYKQRKFLIRFIINMLGKPFCNLDFKWNGKAKSSARLSAEFLVQCILKIENDILSFLRCAEISEYKLKSKSKRRMPYLSEENFHDEVNLDLSDKDEDWPFLNIAVLYYLVFSEQLCIEYMPFVYNTYYIFFCCLHLSTLLMLETEYTILHKGLLFADAALSRIIAGSITSSILEPEIHCKFIGSLCSVIVHCSVDEYRKLAVKILRNYLQKFERKAQYFILAHFPSLVQESSIQGFLVTFLKDIILKELSDCKNISPYFNGKRLNSLINIYCSLPKGAETDLNEEMSRIIAALNLIRYIVLRDKYDKIGFSANIHFLKSYFICPLSQAINLSRAHFKLKLKEEKERNRKTEVGPEVTITISGEEIKPDAIAAIDCALLNFDLIESVLVRVNECIEML